MMTQNGFPVVTALIVLPLVAAVALAGPGLWGAVLGLACVPLALKAVRAFAGATDPEVFNQCLRRTAGFQAALCGATCLGLMVSGAF